MKNSGKEIHMKKRFIRGLAASIFAVLMAAMIAVVPVSASFFYNGTSYPDKRQLPTNIYATENVYGNGNYWYPNLEAYYEFNTNSPSVTKKPVTAYSTTNSYFNYMIGNYQTDNNLNSPYVYSVARFISNGEGNGVAYRDGSGGKFYPTQSMATDAGVQGVYLRKYEYRGSGNYFNTETGRYYGSIADCLAASGDAYDVMINHGGLWYDRNYTETYMNSKTNKFYLSEAEAKAADASGKVTRYITPTQGYYFNQGNGCFYMTAYIAAGHTSEADVIRATSFSFSNGIMDSFGVNAMGTGMPLYIPAGGDSGYVTSGAPAGTLPGSSTASTPSTLPASVSPYDENSTASLRSNYSYKGWTAIAGFVDTTSAGANMTILMNQDTVVSSTFMKSVSGRDINVTLVNPNGSQIRFNGLDVYSPKDMPVSVVYSATSIPQAEYQKTVRSADAAAASVFTVGTEVDLGAVVKVYIRFNASREEDSASIYLYSSAKKAASLVDTKTIGEDGLAVFEIRNGGQYIACIIEN
jgi:hypothetical protein